MSPASIAFGKFCQKCGTDNVTSTLPLFHRTIGVARSPWRSSSPDRKRYPRNVTGTRLSRLTWLADCQRSPPLES